jgi:hypothetical protein
MNSQTWQEAEWQLCQKRRLSWQQEASKSLILIRFSNPQLWYFSNCLVELAALLSFIRSLQSSVSCQLLVSS